MARSHPTERCWSGRVLVGLLLARTAWMRPWLQAHTRDAGSVPMKPLRSRIHVVDREGQLSEDVREAQARGLDNESQIYRCQDSVTSTSGRFVGNSMGQSKGGMGE